MYVSIHKHIYNIMSQHACVYIQTYVYTYMHSTVTTYFGDDCLVLFPTSMLISYIILNSGLPIYTEARSMCFLVILREENSDGHE